jgi:hypothetical protein
LAEREAKGRARRDSTGREAGRVPRARSDDGALRFRVWQRAVRGARALYSAPAGGLQHARGGAGRQVADEMGDVLQQSSFQVYSQGLLKRQDTHTHNLFQFVFVYKYKTEYLQKGT